MGHERSVHDQYYRMDDVTVEAAKMSKLLHLSSKGQMALQKGKNLSQMSYILSEDDDDEDEDLEGDEDTDDDKESNRNHSKNPKRRGRKKKETRKENLSQKFNILSADKDSDDDEERNRNQSKPLKKKRNKKETCKAPAKKKRQTM